MSMDKLISKLKEQQEIENNIEKYKELMNKLSIPISSKNGPFVHIKDLFEIFTDKKKCKLLIDKLKEENLYG